MVSPLLVMIVKPFESTGGDMEKAKSFLLVKDVAADSPEYLALLLESSIQLFMLNIILILVLQLVEMPPN
jgi:hypothetical protein